MTRFMLALALVAALAGCGSSKSANSDTNAATSSAASTAAATTAQTAAGSSTVSTTTRRAAAPGKVVLHGRYRYPAILIRNYMKSCVGAAGSGSKKRAYCACTLDKLSNNVSTRDFAEIGLSNGRIPPRIKRFMSQAVADCANKL